MEGIIKSFLVVAVNSKPVPSFSILQEATAWLEHAASLVCSPSPQEKEDMVAVLEDCSHALQCVNTLSTIETSQVRLVRRVAHPLS